MFSTIPFSRTRAGNGSGPSARSLGKPPASYPGAIATDAKLAIAVDRQQTTLAAPLNSSELVMTVASAALIVPNCLLSIDNEIVQVTSVSGTQVNITRGFDGTTPALHLAGAMVMGFVDAWHHNALVSEIQAIETTLGANLSRIPAVPFLVSTAYQFPAQSPGGALVAGNNSITLSPVPAGVNGTDQNHYLYISGGTGAAEAALITGGTAVAGAPTGTVIVNCANAHSGTWTIQSATAGIQEALNSVPSGGVCVYVPAGQHTIQGSIQIARNDVTIKGEGRTSTRLSYTGTGAAFVYSGIGGNAAAGAFLSGLFIGGNNTGSWGITANLQNGMILRDLYIAQFQNGIRIDGSQTFDVYIEDVNISYIAASTGVGIFLNGGAGHYLDHVQIAGDSANQPFAGIRIQTSYGFYIASTDVIAAGHGIMMDPGNGQAIQWGFITDTTLDSGSAYGIRIDPTGNATITGLTFTSCWTSTNTLSGVLINKGVSSIVDTIQFNGHRSYNNGDNGYMLYPGPINVMFSDCQAAGNSRTTPGSGHGLLIGAGASQFQVVGGLYAFAVNGLPNRQGYGIIILSGASDNYSIFGAIVSPNVTGGLSDGGTGLNRVIRLAAGTINIPTFASAASVDPGFGDEDVFYVTGTTTITTIQRGWKGRTIRLIKTDAGSLTIGGGGGNVPGSHTLAQNLAVTLTFDGTNWY